MGLLSKIFSGIKKVVKGVAKGIKKVVKGVGKVVKKVAKSKIFKAMLVAAAIYVTGGAAAGAFGATGSGFFGTWAANAANVVGGTSALGAAGKVLTPFSKLGKALGTGARGVSDFVGFTEKGAKLGADAITGVSETIGGTTPGSVPLTATQQGITAGSTYYDPVNQVYIDKATGKAVTGEWWKERAASAAASQGVGPPASAATKVTKGGRWAQGTILGDVARGVGTSVASGYLMDKINPAFEEGRMAGLSLEGPGNLDPFAVYDPNGQPLSVSDAYSSLMYGNIDPFAAKDPLYTQATVDV